MGQTEGGGVHLGELVQVHGLGLVAVQTKFEKNSDFFDSKIDVLERTPLVENGSLINVVQFFDVIFCKQSQVLNVSVVSPEKVYYE